MTESVGIEDTSLTQRVVLLGLAARSANDGTPAHAGEVRQTCTERLDAIEGDVVGTLSEAEVSRSLNELEADGLLTAERDETSPAGKGRPHYDLAVAPEDVLDDLSADDRVQSLVQTVSGQ